MRVLGWKRSATAVENVDRVYASAEGEGIDELLRESDYVVLCVELNNDTYHIISAEKLALMKKSAFLINMGRGKLVDEAALCSALESGAIAGAGLDTFEVEPLPQESPLWGMQNVIITPHITPQLPDREERMLSYVFENIKAYREGGKFVNRVTERNMLTKEG